MFSLRVSLFSAMAPLGLAVLGPLAETIGIRSIYLLDGAACLLVALLWSVTRSVRVLDRGPPKQEGRHAREKFKDAGTTVLESQ